MSKSKPFKCYLIDYGLARRFTSDTGLREQRSGLGFRGTARYASINAHLGLDLGRVDDLWSLFYVIVEFLVGTLPWKGKDKELVGSLKRQYTTIALVSGLPKQLAAVFHHLKSLSFTDTPDYNLLHNLFAHLDQGNMTIAGTICYDWEVECDSSSSVDKGTTICVPEPIPPKTTLKGNPRSKRYKGKYTM